MQLLRSRIYRDRGKKEKVHLFDIKLNFESKEVSFKPKGNVYLDKYSHESISNIIQTAKEKKTPEVLIKDVACGTSSSIIVELPNKTQYMLLVLRDPKAKRNPSKIDTPSGVIDTRDPLESVLREMVEEVIMVSKDAAVIPKYGSSPLSKYNPVIAKTVGYLAKALNIKKKVISNAESASLKNGFKYNGKNGIMVDLGFCTFKGGNSNMLDLILPPTIIKYHSLGSFRETMAVETRGKDQERDVLLLKIKGPSNAPGLIIYREGSKLKRYASMDAYLRTNFIDPTILNPSAASLLDSMGLQKKVIDHGMYNAPLSSLINE